MVRLRLLALFLLAAAAPAHAGVNLWTNAGPEGGNVFAFAVHPSAPSVVYAGLQTNTYKSTDAGATWKVSMNGLATNALSQLAVNPVTPSTLYVGSIVGVFKSTDGAASWALASNGLTTLEMRAVAIDPVTPATLYAGTFGGGVFKSTDSGGTWTPTNTGLPNLNAQALAIDPAAPATVYLGTAGGAFKSTNGGGSWSHMSALTQTNIFTVAVHPGATSTVFAGTGNGVWRSTDGGTGWALSNGGLVNPFGIRAFLFEPGSTTSILAGSGTGVYKSTDGGSSWVFSSTGLRAPSLATIAAHPSSAGTLLAGGNRVFKSTDGAASWAASDTGIGGSAVRALAYDPATPATVYAGLGNGVSKSTNGGAAWAGSSAGLTNTNVRSVAVDPVTPATVYTGTDAGVFRTTNGGGAWAPATTGISTFSVRALAIDPTSPSTLYAATPNAGAWKTTDSGASWAPASAGLTSLDVRGLAHHPTTGGTLWAATIGGVMKTTDGGASWTPSGAGLPIPTAFAVAVNPATPAVLYVATGGTGIYRSSDGGASWHPWNDGLENAFGSLLAIDPVAPARVYANAVWVYEQAAPSVTGVNATISATIGGQSVTITGTGFRDGAAVTFGGTPALGTTFLSPGALMAVTPPHAPGAVDVVVTNPDGLSGTLASGLVYFCGSLQAQATATGSASICAGGSSQIAAHLVGTPPFSITWSDGVTQSGLLSSPATRNVSPVSTTTYTLTAASDVYCSLFASGGATITANPVPGAPTAGNNGPITAGQTLQLFATTVSGATYSWTGPNGFASASQNPTIPGATAAASGQYAVTVTVLGCTSAAGTTNAVVNPGACNPGCDATVPAIVKLGANASFSCSVTTGGCTGQPAFDWNYGDATTHGTAQNPSHLYAAAGTFGWEVTVTVDGVPCGDSGTIVVSRSGDVNDDGTVNVADVFALINFLFAAGTPPAGWADANGDLATTVADVFYLISHLFAGGPAPV